MGEQKTAIVTGGGSGIGKAAALKLAEQGYRVALFELKEERAREVGEFIDSSGGTYMIENVDVSNEEKVASGIRHVFEKWGRIDVLFDNAGINGTIAPIEEMEASDWDHTIQTNLKSTFLLVKHAIPYMKEVGGSIIITSSINGSRTFSNIGFSAYSSSKAGQITFMKMAALELARYKIRVNAICPGAVDTNIGQNTEEKGNLDKVRIPVEFPNGDKPLENAPGNPEQIADLVYFLASEHSSHITGTEIYIDGAESLL
ncbi:SDR family oxidoreductase [Thalassobacillus pellis]|uniref:SDR family oxidoreductase n=1 Tax=Thalassobacillus pellis TaxID=748008 RepID=UPI00195F525B|nr:SDR family NAD(P)-dependent oxidoreductase [Thalassobacillus pellis]MBM7552572.1 NAD(P)-dependent dehydrogenase (short-subunit alcohol dehydrogenase family) [Thalassobacillus pellis]